MLNVRELEAFRAFIVCGSVTSAAERLNRTQPQVGRLLVSLEESVGFRLFNRIGNRLQATPEGWRFYEEVDRVMRELQSLTRSADEIRSGSSDHLRVLATPHGAIVFVSRALALAQQKVPNLTAEVASRTRLDIETWITQEQFDVGVGVLPIANSVVEVEPFLRTRAVAVMSKTHPLARRRSVKIADLFDVALIGTPGRTLLRQNLERLFQENGKQPYIRFEATNGVVACELAAQGLGVALADPFVALSAGAGRSAILPFATEMRLEYGFLYPIGKTRSHASHELTEAMRKTAEQCLTELGLPETAYTTM